MSWHHKLNDFLEAYERGDLETAREIIQEHLMIEHSFVADLAVMRREIHEFFVALEQCRGDVARHRQNPVPKEEVRAHVEIARKSLRIIRDVIAKLIAEELLEE
ncbi:hypothetical protein D6789_02500 [Candidatus Woesearchaeota archaeon]|nr:MAG: hypothetical protein D6789_02500 [Candidatus Woesearchaeota archaeon]